MDKSSHGLTRQYRALESAKFLFFKNPSRTPEIFCEFPFSVVWGGRAWLRHRAHPRASEGHSGNQEMTPWLVGWPAYPCAFKTLFPTAFGCKVMTFIPLIIPKPGSAARTVSAT